ncbi:hypothetical protein WS75_01065 [Burkholderia sp. FL-7-2-10-S1-D7]|nr:hypothetical protein WS75_01065 [Burkholderia sp. FL-7-2-10-S1-D7]
MEAARLGAGAGRPQRFVAECDRAWGDAYLGSLVDDQDVDFVTGPPIGQCGAGRPESGNPCAERQRQRTLRR